jgi:hypothetical protein
LYGGKAGGCLPVYVENLKDIYLCKVERLEAVYCIFVKVERMEAVHQRMV